MNKKFIPLILLSTALLMTGCAKKEKSKSNSGETPTSGQPGESEVVTGVKIELSTVGMSVASGSTYPASATNFTAGGKAWVASNGVGIAAAHKGKDSGYNELSAMQFRKADEDTKLRGSITNSEAITTTKITCVWLATYENEDSQYFPVVKAGSSASSLTAVSANETSTTGEDTGKKEYFSNKSASYEVYRHTTTYTIASGNTFFSLEGPSGGAGYVVSFTLA